jgi:DNA-binding protein HU-beta
MNKGELVDAIWEKAGVSKSKADAILAALADTIVTTVGIGEKVTLAGFGSFEKRDRAAREGRNPKTGESITIGPRPFLPSAPGKPSRKLWRLSRKPRGRSRGKAIALHWRRMM